MDAMQRHMNNLSRLVGHDVSSRYGYAVDKDSLSYKLMQVRDEVLRPLQQDYWNKRVELYKKKDVEKEVRMLVEKCIMSEIGRIEEMVANDISRLIDKELNAIPQMKGGSNSNYNKVIVSSMANRLADGLIDIINRTVNNNK